MILSQLSRVGLVRARRGRIGGYVLARPAVEIAIVDVVGAVGERNDHPPASTSDPYQRLRGELIGVIDTLTLADLLDENAGF